MFLLSCVITARYFERKRMHTASVMYSVLFLITFTFALFSLDYSVVRVGLSNMFGEELYLELRHTVLGIINTSYFGISFTTLFSVVCILQSIFAIIGLTRCIVRYCFVKQKPLRKFNKAYSRFVLLVRNLYLPRRINLLYCRMLN